MAIKKTPYKQWLIGAAKVAVAGLIITWLVTSGKFNPEALKKIGRPEIWCAGIVLFLCGLGINAQRWRCLLRLEDVNLAWREAWELSLIGIFFNFVIPGGVGGDVVKVSYLFKKYTDKKVFLGWATLIDRIFGMSALLVYAGVAGFFYHQELGSDVGGAVRLLSFAILGGAVLGAFFLFLGPLKSLSRRLENAPKADALLGPLIRALSDPEKIIRPIGLSFVGQMFMIGVVAALGQMLGEDFPISIYFLLVPLGMITTILPIAPAGLGVGQAAYFYLFQTVCGNGEFGVLAITFQQAVQFLVGLLGGILFVMYGKKTGSLEHG